MKKLVIILLLFPILFSNCEKRAFDYRNKFDGYYQFDFIVTAWDASINDFRTDGTSLEGTVSYDKNGPRDEMYIDISGLERFTVTIDKNGNLESCGGTGKIVKGESVIYDYNTMLCDGLDSLEMIAYHLEGAYGTAP